jgi:hypothetical protein
VPDLPATRGGLQEGNGVLLDHKGKELCLPEAALKGHLKHGDEVIDEEGCSDPRPRRTGGTDTKAWAYVVVIGFHKEVRILGKPDWCASKAPFPSLMHVGSCASPLKCPYLLAG